MKSQRLAGYAPLTMTIESFELDETLPPGHMLVEAHTTAISAGTEIANYRGMTHQHSAELKDWSDKPYFPGYSLAGIVLKIGPGVTEFAVGDRVCGMAKHASHAVVDSHQFVHIPDGVSFDYAAMTTLTCIVMNAVRLAKLELGESVAVIGAGLIGQLAVQLSRLDGARPVVAIDPIEARRKLAHESGSDFEIDPMATDRAAQIKRIVGDRGFNCVFEATGSPAPFNDALKMIGFGGKMILLGSTRGKVEQFDPYADVHLNGVTMIGAHMRTHPAHETQFNRWTWVNNRKLALTLIRDGDLKLEPLISHRESASMGPEMFRRLHEARESFYGVLLHWDH
ncbi:zinc-dependent alcohol dehydrogenase [Roseixanthobacter liquoris]|uniref:zinc-dependent alcohol dehydrogenase n=1 Tax=Roseixanthobacter liquoris TaxID=3119921 RepID=UPI00372C7DE3